VGAAALLLAVSSCRSAVSDPGARVTRILVDKSERRLDLLADGVPIRTYKVALGRSPEGPKVQEGDNRTPEGIYVIDSRSDRSVFHRALHISYPNEEDRARAARLGVAPGGNILIHGMRNGMGWIGHLHLAFDWTRGCIAVTNAEIDEIWKLVPDGTPIEIRP
jgi:murein L,D-transpeptidase YafK